ncbi:MAG: hypothetical protein QM528_09435 [Phycisphaerales bacterium]|nr:hypothetical protein [Phycisphaerales bacterium]
MTRNTPIYDIDRFLQLSKKYLCYVARQVIKPIKKTNNYFCVATVFLLVTTACTKANNTQMPIPINIALVSPANEATNQPVQPIFVWQNSDTSITSYKIYYGTNLNNLVQDLNNYTVNTNLSDTIRLSPDGFSSPYLSYNTKYYWKVVGVNASGMRVDSNSSSFTVRNALNLNAARYALGLAVYNDTLYAVGGYYGSSYLNSVEVFSNATGWRTATQRLNSIRGSFGLVTYNDSLYAVGGTSYGFAGLNSVEVFSNATGWRTATQRLNTARYGLSLVAYKDSLFAIAGYSNDIFFNSIENFTVGGGWMLSSKTLNRQLLSPGATVANNRLYVAGGYDGSNAYRTVEVYDGTNWTSAPSMNTARASFGMATYNNKIYVAGGLGSTGNLDSVEVFNGNNWQSCTPMPTSRYGLGFTEYKGLLYAVGGSGDMGIVSIVEIYNPVTNQWQ